MRITRLGQGVDRTGRLDPEAIERTVAVLREYREVMDDLGVDRRADRGDLGGPRRGQPRRVLRRRRPTILGVRPGAADRRRKRRRLSLPRRHRRPRPELTGRSSWSTSAAARPSSCSAPTSAESSISIDMGCVRLTEKYLHARPARCPRSCRKRLAVVEQHLDDVPREVPARRRRRPGSSGWPARSPPWPRSRSACPSTTATRIHHFVLTRAAAEDVFRTLATESLADRIAQPRAGAGPRRRHRRRLLRARRRSCATSASTSAWCRSPTSSTA